MLERSLFKVVVFLAASVSAHCAWAEKINVVSGISPVFAPAFIADLNGYYKDEGLDVTVRTFQAGAAANEAFRSTGAQYLVTCDQPMLLQASGGDSSIVTQFSENDHMVIIVAKNDVKGPADLKGKKIGLFRKSASEYMLQQYMKSAGLSVSDVEMVHLAPFDQVAALVKGDVDALSIWKPFDLKVFGLSKDFKVVADTGDMGYALYCGMVASREYLNSGDRAEIAKFMRAIKKASDWLTNSDPETAYAAIAKYTKLAANDVKHTVEGQSWSLVSDEKFRAQLKNLEQFLADLGMLKKPVDWNTAVDWSLLKELDPNLVK